PTQRFAAAGQRAATAHHTQIAQGRLHGISFATCDTAWPSGPSLQPRLTRLSARADRVRAAEDAPGARWSAGRAARAGRIFSARPSDWSIWRPRVLRTRSLSLR